MLSTVTLYGYAALDKWVIILLFTLNSITALITFYNLWYLYKTLPKIEDRAWNSETHKTMENVVEIQEMEICIYRKSIEKYFYLITIIPLFVSIACHYGARFPAESVWIFPGMNITIAIAYLFFIRMMILSCDGWSNVENILTQQKDECNSMKHRPIYNKCCKSLCCKLCLKKNAYKGLRQRIYFCYLIMLKPMVNYATAYFEYDYGTTYNQKYIQFIVRILTILTTFIPMQNMKSFHCTLLPYTRLRRSTIKRKFVSFLAPLCQIQQGLVGLIFNLWTFGGFGNVETKYDWCVAYGIILCCEMLIYSLFIRKAFDPKDLRLWQYSESFIKQDEHSGQHQFLYDDEPKEIIN
eukprot:272466_1